VSKMTDRENEIKFLKDQIERMLKQIQNYQTGINETRIVIQAFKNQIKKLKKK